MIAEYLRAGFTIPQALKAYRAKQKPARRTPGFLRLCHLPTGILATLGNSLANYVRCTGASASEISEFFNGTAPATNSISLFRQAIAEDFPEQLPDLDRRIERHRAEFEVLQEPITIPPPRKAKRADPDYEALAEFVRRGYQQKYPFMELAAGRGTSAASVYQRLQQQRLVPVIKPEEQIPQKTRIPALLREAFRTQMITLGLYLRYYRIDTEPIVDALNGTHCWGEMQQRFIGAIARDFPGIAEEVIADFCLLAGVTPPKHPMMFDPFGGFSKKITEEDLVIARENETLLYREEGKDTIVYNLYVPQVQGRGRDVGQAIAAYDRLFEKGGVHA